MYAPPPREQVLCLRPANAQLFYAYNVMAMRAVRYPHRPANFALDRGGWTVGLAGYRCLRLFLRNGRSGQLCNFLFPKSKEVIRFILWIESSMFWASGIDAR